jgi:hypothetical protein
MLSRRDGSAVGVAAAAVPPHASVGNNINIKMIVNCFIAPSSGTNEKPIGIDFGQSVLFDYEATSDFLRSIDWIPAPSAVHTTRGVKINQPK